MRSRIFALAFVAVSLAPQAFAEETLKATVVAKPADAAAAPAAATGGFNNTACTNGKNKRTIELTSTNATTKLPCEVHYKKETEQTGHDQVLWKADNDLKFCESKAQAFVEKLTGLGWTCGKM